MHRASRVFVAIVASICLIASLALSGCATGRQGVSDPGSTANDASLQGQQVADDMMDVETWNAFASNSTAAVLGSSAQDPNGNACFSPASLYFALALAAQGADGDAQSQLLELLGTKDADALSVFCRKWISQIEHPFGEEDAGAQGALNDAKAAESDEAGVDDTGSDGKVQLANSVWIKDGFTFKRDYIDIIQNSLGASSFNVDFGTPEADSQITQWVSDETKGLLQPEFHTTDADIAKLINTVYFKSSWTDQFDTASTTDGVFHSPEADMPASFMHKFVESGSFAQGGNFTACQLGFTNGYTMSFYLPDEGTTPSDLLQDATGIQQLLEAQFDYRPVDLTLPKFSIDSSFGDLIDALRSLGVTDVFDPTNAGMFANMIETNDGIASGDFYISDAIQETHLGLDENGVEAAAYTALGIKETAMMPEEEPVEFVVDRPFAYTVQSPDGVVLFAGMVNAV